MDSGTLIMGAVLIAICVLPFVIVGRNRKKKKKQILQLLTNIAKKYNAQISRYDFCAGFAIGLDETKNAVVLYKQGQDGVTENYVNLSEIQKSRAVTTHRTVGDKDRNFNVIDRLDLVLVPIAKQKEDIKLPFFDAEDSLQMSSEMPLAEKWSDLINGRLKG